MMKTKSDENAYSYEPSGAIFFLYQYMLKKNYAPFTDFSEYKFTRKNRL